MTYNTQTQTSNTGRAIAGLFVAGVTFILGYTVVRASLAERQVTTASDADVEVVVPSEGTLWADFGTSY